MQLCPSNVRGLASTKQCTTEVMRLQVTYELKLASCSCASVKKSQCKMGQSLAAYSDSGNKSDSESAADQRGGCSLLELPTNVLQEIFVWCGIEEQRLLAHSSHIFRTFWTTLQLHQDPVDAEGYEEKDISYLTAHRWWQRYIMSDGAEHLVMRIRTQSGLKPARAWLLPITQQVYHLSLVGHLSERHMQYILQQGSSDAALLNEQVIEQFENRIGDELRAGRPELHASAVFMTFKLHHSRQQGFTDSELDRLGTIFADLPWILSGRTRMVDIRSICEPLWQLVSPHGQAIGMYWQVTRSRDVDYVAELAQACKL